jgi:hypothetical protein
MNSASAISTDGFAGITGGVQLAKRGSAERLEGESARLHQQLDRWTARLQIETQGGQQFAVAGPRTWEHAVGDERPAWLRSGCYPAGLRWRWYWSTRKGNPKTQKACSARSSSSST